MRRAEDGKKLLLVEKRWRRKWVVRRHLCCGKLLPCKKLFASKLTIGKRFSDVGVSDFSISDRSVCFFVIRLRVPCRKELCEQSPTRRLRNRVDNFSRKKVMVIINMINMLKVLVMSFSTALRLKLKTTTNRLNEMQEQYQAAEVNLERVKRSEKELIERVSKLQTSLNAETSQRIALENNIRDMESRQKRIMEQLREEHEIVLKRNEDQVKSLTEEISNLKSQLGRVEELPPSLERASSDSQHHQTSQSTHSHKQRSGTSTTPSMLSGGDSSFAASERYSQLLKQRDDKMEDLMRQIQQSQVVYSNSVTLTVLTLRIIDFKGCIVRRSGFSQL